MWTSPPSTRRSRRHSATPPATRHGAAPTRPTGGTLHPVHPEPQIQPEHHQAATQDPRLSTVPPADDAASSARPRAQRARRHHPPRSQHPVPPTRKGARTPTRTGSPRATSWPIGLSSLATFSCPRSVCATPPPSRTARSWAAHSSRRAHLGPRAPTRATCDRSARRSQLGRTNAAIPLVDRIRLARGLRPPCVRSAPTAQPTARSPAAPRRASVSRETGAHESGVATSHVHSRTAASADGRAGQSGADPTQRASHAVSRPLGASPRLPNPEIERTRVARQHGIRRLETRQLRSTGSTSGTTEPPPRSSCRTGPDIPRSRTERGRRIAADAWPLRHGCIRPQERGNAKGHRGGDALRRAAWPPGHRHPGGARRRRCHSAGVSRETDALLTACVPAPTPTPPSGQLRPGLVTTTTDEDAGRHAGGARARPIRRVPERDPARPDPTRFHHRRRSPPTGRVATPRGHTTSTRAPEPSAPRPPAPMLLSHATSRTLDGRTGSHPSSQAAEGDVTGFASIAAPADQVQAPRRGPHHLALTTPARRAQRATSRERSPGQCRRSRADECSARPSIEHRSRGATPPAQDQAHPGGAS